MHFKLKNAMKWCWFLLLIYAVIILSNIVNTGQRMEQEKKSQILMEDNDEKTVHPVFTRTILKEQWDLLEDNLYKRWGIISTTDKQNFDKYCSSIET